MYEVIELILNEANQKVNLEHSLFEIMTRGRHYFNNLKCSVK